MQLLLLVNRTPQAIAVGYKLYEKEQPEPWKFWNPGNDMIKKNERQYEKIIFRFVRTMPLILKQCQGYKQYQCSLL